MRAPTIPHGYRASGMLWRAPDPPGPPWQGGTAFRQRHPLPARRRARPVAPSPDKGRAGEGLDVRRALTRAGSGLRAIPRAPKKHPAHQSVRGESENGSRRGARGRRVPVTGVMMQ